MFYNLKASASFTDEQVAGAEFYSKPFDPDRWILLRSAVGKTHVLRLGLVMDYTTSYFPLIVLGPLPDTLCPGACIPVPIVFQVRSLYVP